MLQCVVVCFSGLQWVAVRCRVVQSSNTNNLPPQVGVSQSVQCVAACCSVLQPSNTSTSLLQVAVLGCVAISCRVLPYVAVCSNSNLMQYVATNAGRENSAHNLI